MPAATACLPAFLPAFLPAASTHGTHRMAICRQRGKEIGPKRQKAGRVDTWNAQNGDLPSTRQGNRPKTAKSRPRRHMERTEWRFAVNAANTSPPQPDAAVSPPFPSKRHRPTPEAPPFPSKRHRPAWQKSIFSTTFPAKTEKLRRKSAKTSLSFSRRLDTGAGFTMFRT